MDTFMDSINLIGNHLDQLEKIDGKLLMMGKDEEYNIMVDKPSGRSLFHYPNTNLYYFQSQISNNMVSNNINDSRVTIQMTFGVHISKLFDVIRVMLTDDLRTFEKETDEFIRPKLTALNNVHRITTKLLEAYNISEEIYRIEATNKENIVVVQNIQNYMYLILYSLYNYFNRHKSNTLLKSYLPFHSRHTNYDLYLELKKNVALLLKDKMKSQTPSQQNETVIKIIQRMFVQPKVLYKHMIQDETLLKKYQEMKVFDRENVLDDSNTNYGNPKYSFITYFVMFENPVMDMYGEDYVHDWFVFNGITNISTRMPIENDIVITEFRNFHTMIWSFIKKYNIDDVTNIAAGFPYNKNFGYRFGTSLPLFMIRELCNVLKQQETKETASDKKYTNKKRTPLTRTITRTKSLG
jgi:hypothetical protein